MTNQNYYKVIALLKNRYGQTQKIINEYMRSLLDIPVSDERLESLRAFYDKSEAYITGLESLGQCHEILGSLLIPDIFGKLPPDFKKKYYTRKREWWLEYFKNTETLFAEIF